MSIPKASGMEPTPSNEFFRFAFEAYISMQPRPRRVRFLTVMRAIADAAIAEDLKEIETDQERRAILHAREEARDMLDDSTARLIGL